MAKKQEEPRFAIELPKEKHHRAAFFMWREVLDSYLHKQAGQDARKRAAVPFVATTDGRTMAGYYTLSQFAIELDAIPEEVARRLPKYPMVSRPFWPSGSEYRISRAGPRRDLAHGCPPPQP